MDKLTLKNLRLDLAIKAKSGIDFIIAAAITWALVGFIWTWPNSSFDKSIFTFYVGMLMLPLAFLFSKVLNTQWKIKTNPLQSLGMWLNLAQLFYFPLLFFILKQHPDYFVMAYIIITGAHFFPYAWFYDEIGYAIFAGIISVGALLITLNVAVENIFYVPLYMVFCLVMLIIWLSISNRRKRNSVL